LSQNQVTAIPIPGSVISLDRYENMCRFLHFIGKTSNDTFEGQQNLFKFHSIIRHLNSKFQVLYLPKQDTSVDELQMLWKGHLSFTQLMSLKSTQFTAKTFKLCKIILSVFLHSLYWKGNHFGLIPYFQRHAKSDSNSTKAF